MPARKRYSDQQLLILYGSGMKRSLIAKQLGVSAPAISKRLRYLSSCIEPKKTTHAVEKIEPPDASLNVQQAFIKQGITPDYIAEKLKNHSNSKDPSISLRGLQEVSKILNLYRSEEDKTTNLALIAQLVIQVRDQMGGNDNED